MFGRRNKIRSKEKLGPKKILVQKNSRPKKISKKKGCSEKKVWSEILFLPEKICSSHYFCFK